MWQEDGFSICDIAIDSALPLLHHRKLTRATLCIINKTSNAGICVIASHHAKLDFETRNFVRAWMAQQGLSE
jgi:hypothetical protein